MPKPKRKPTKPKPDPLVKLARTILPPEQIRPGQLAIRDVANHSDDDQRRMVRSGETKTVRKLTRVERLQKAGVLERHHAAACEWYAEAHEMGYGTIGCTANYTGAGGVSGRSSDLMAKYADQALARDNYLMAKEAIPHWIKPLFDGVILGWVGEQQLRNVINNKDKAAVKIRLAADLLYGRISPYLSVEV